MDTLERYNFHHNANGVEHKHSVSSAISSSINGIWHQFALHFQVLRIISKVFGINYMNTASKKEIKEVLFELFVSNREEKVTMPRE